MQETAKNIKWGNTGVGGKSGKVEIKIGKEISFIRDLILY